MNLRLLRNPFSPGPAFYQIQTRSVVITWVPEGRAGAAWTPVGPQRISEEFSPHLFKGNPTKTQKISDLPLSVWRPPPFAAGFSSRLYTISAGTKLPVPQGTFMASFQTRDTGERERARTPTRGSHAVKMSAWVGLGRMSLVDSTGELLYSWEVLVPGMQSETSQNIAFVGERVEAGLKKPQGSGSQHFWAGEAGAWQ